jgi:hypothetical protein
MPATATSPAMLPFPRRRPLDLPDMTVTLPSSAPPALFVVVDTEEEFDWNAPYSRANTSVTAMFHIERAQKIFDRYGVKPTYVIDYPIATKPDGFAPLKQFMDDDRCSIGAHLHPWVNPPFDEDVIARNSFACNLSPALEEAKIAALGAAIRESFGIEPKSYKAGRYGLDAVSVETLETLGYEIDLSVNPHMDFTPLGGPSFKAFGAAPFFRSGARDGLFFLPCTMGFVGMAGERGAELHALASRPALQPLKAVGILSRLGITNRIMLSPEGNTLSEMKSLARTLHGRGLRTFAMTFHSPSAAVGHTPYVRTEDDLVKFLDRIDGFCEFFFRNMNGVAGRPFEFRSSLVKEWSR